MAEESPALVENSAILFKEIVKLPLFSDFEIQSQIIGNLLATANSHGLLFVGNPIAPEIRAFLQKDLIFKQADKSAIKMRKIPLQNVPNVIACSADDSLLAVNYTHNTSAMLQILSAPSFLMPQIQTLYNINLSPEINLFGKQLLWNPVIPSNFAIIMSNGSVGVYNLKQAGQYGFHSLSNQPIQCGCWSPKGKQIVLGTLNGNLLQFKPDLTLAKTIPGPTGIFAGNFDTIGLHWLSTFQFATVYLEHGDEKIPFIFIINAQKGVKIRYIKYYDICYSNNGPKQLQFSFYHIPQWKLIILISSNGVEVGVLGTSDDNTDTPSWKQYVLAGDSRIEMPLNKDNDDTYPRGFVISTIAAQQPEGGIMPSVFALSSSGILLSYNFLNLDPNALNVCIPMPSTIDNSGEFYSILGDSKDIKTVAAANTFAPAVNTFAPAANTFAPAANTFAPAANTFAPAVNVFAPANNQVPHQTVIARDPPKIQPVNTMPTIPIEPAKSVIIESKSFYNTPQTQPALSVTSNTVASKPMNDFSFNISSNSAFGTASVPPVYNIPTPQMNFNVGGTAFKAPSSLTIIPTTVPATDCGQIIPAQAPVKTVASPQVTKQPVTKPLYTIPKTFTASQPSSSPATTVNQIDATSNGNAVCSNELNKTIVNLMSTSIASFNTEIANICKLSRNLLANLGDPSEMAMYNKSLNGLDGIIGQSNDRGFELDAQNLRHEVNECYAMIAEARTKLQMYKEPELLRMTSVTTTDPMNKRQLAKLKSYTTVNDANLKQLIQQVDAQWTHHQDQVRRNTKSHMHIPCLDGVYQRLTKLKDVITHQRSKLIQIKSKLNEKGYGNKCNENTKEQTDLICDSIQKLTLKNSLDQQILSAEKYAFLRNYTKQQRKSSFIKPQRPERIGINSEIILETKLKIDREKAAAEAKKLQKNEKHTQTTQPSVSSKSTISKSTSTEVNFSPSSPFVKTNASNVVVTKDKIVASSAVNANSKTSQAVVTSNISLPTAVNLSIPVVAKSQTAGIITSPNVVIDKTLSSQQSITTAMPSTFASLTMGQAAITKPLLTTPPTNNNINKPSTNVPLQLTKSESKIDVPSVKPLAANFLPTLPPNQSLNNADVNKALLIADGIAPPMFGNTNAISSSKPFSFDLKQTTTTLPAASTAIAASPGNAFSFSGFGTAPVTSLATQKPVAAIVTAPTSQITPTLSKPDGTAPLSVFGSTTNTTFSTKFSFGGLSSTTATVPTLAPAVSSITPAPITSSAITMASPISPTANITGRAPMPTVETPAMSLVKGVATMPILGAGAAIIPKSNPIIAKGIQPTSPQIKTEKDATENLLSPLNICKPTTKGANVTVKPVANLFAGTNITTTAANNTVTNMNKFSPATTLTTTPTNTCDTGDTAKLIFAATAANLFPKTSTSPTAPTSPVSSPSAIPSTKPPILSPNPSNIFATAAAKLAQKSPTTAFAGSTTPSFFVPNTLPPANTNLISDDAKPVSTNLFANINIGGAKTSITGGNIFNSTPKQDTTNTSGNAFSGFFTGTNQANTINNTTPNKLFGAVLNQQSMSGGPLFGDQSSFSSAPMAGTNVFGQMNTSTAFGAPTDGNMFNSNANFAGTQQTSTFGTNPVGGSGFGGFSQTSNSTPFAPVSGGIGGSFAQGGASVAQSGFGASQQQAFGAKPMFGSPVFGATPSFGTQPSFGGAATFGSPKPFGSFASPNANTTTAVTANTSPFGQTQKNNLFETLGSTDTGLSFGNLAQTTNNKANKPTFGGSSFMQYRS